MVYLSTKVAAVGLSGVDRWLRLIISGSGPNGKSPQAFIRTTCTSPGPCTPVTNFNSMSPVLLGPVISDRHAGKPSARDSAGKDSNQSKRSGTTWDPCATAIWTGGSKLSDLG